MKIQVLNEMGYREALYGLGLSYGLTSGIRPDDFIATDTFQKMERVATFQKMERIARKLAFRDGGVVLI